MTGAERVGDAGRALPVFAGIGEEDFGFLFVFNFRHRPSDPQIAYALRDLPERLSFI